MDESGGVTPSRVLDFFAHTTAATFGVPAAEKNGASDHDQRRSGGARLAMRASASNRIASHYSLPASMLRLQGGLAADTHHHATSFPVLKGATRVRSGAGQQHAIAGLNEAILAVGGLVSAALLPADEALSKNVDSTRTEVPLLQLPAAPGIPRRRPVLTFGGNAAGGAGSPRRNSVIGDSFRSEAPPDHAPPPPPPALRCVRLQLRFERLVVDAGAVPADAAARFNAAVFAAASARARSAGMRGLPPLPLSRVRRPARLCLPPTSPHASPPHPSACRQRR